jgi:peroxiredoxin
MIKKDNSAPEFTLKDQHGQTFSLADMKGKKVLLSFHPLAWTPVCRDQMLSLEKNFDRFSKLNTVAVGINVDPLPSKKAWAEAIGLTSLRILSDFWPHGNVAKMYDIFREKEGFSERANIIVDAHGKVAFIKVYPIPQLPDIEEIIKILETVKD